MFRLSVYFGETLVVYAMVWQGICGLALLYSIRHKFFIREDGYRRKATILPLNNGGNS
jgi:hypothetical protein